MGISLMEECAFEEPPEEKPASNQVQKVGGSFMAASKFTGQIPGFFF